MENRITEEIRQIAGRIRELREILDMTQVETAEAAGIPLKQYVAYENAEDDIPVSTIYSLANVLGVDPTVLLTGEAPRMCSYTIIRGGNGVSVNRYDGYRFTSLASNFIGRDMEPMIVYLLPGDTPDLVTHTGQEFNFVLEGKLRIRIGEKDFILNAGDSIYFNPALPHGQFAVDEPARFLTVINE